MLRYSKDDLGLSSPMEYNPCSWNNNWLLNVVASEDCRSADSEDECDVSKDLYRTLSSMSRRKDTFSVMGFVSKFFKVCKRLEKRRVVLKKRSSTQAPKRVSSEVGEDSAQHSYSVRNTNPVDLSRTLIDFGVGDDAEMLSEITTTTPETTTTTKYIETSTTSAPTTPRRSASTPSSPSPISSSSPSVSSSSSSSYVDRYLNQMDQLRNPAMVRYRLGIMFKDLKAADKERPRSTSVSNTGTR